MSDEDESQDAALGHPDDDDETEAPEEPTAPGQGPMTAAKAWPLVDKQIG